MAGQDKNHDAMMSEHEKASFNTASLGIDIEAFANSKVGKFLLDKAERDYDKAAKTLITTPAGETAAIADAQVQARVAVDFKKWINEGILAGRIAEDTLRKMEH